MNAQSLCHFGSDNFAVADPERLAAALERHRAEFATVKGRVCIKIDVAGAALRVLGAQRHWGPYAPRVAALPATECNHALLSQIESIAWATLQADAEYQLTTAPPNDLFERLKEGTALRETLLSEAAILVRRGILPPKVLNRIERAPGYRNVAEGLHSLGVVLDEHWAAVQGKTSITRHELDTARLLAQQMFTNGALRRERHPNQVAAATLLAQAFFWLRRAYDEMRRCLEYLEPTRFEQLAPSLYSGRAPRKKSKPTEAQAIPALAPSMAAGAEPGTPRHSAF